MQVHINEVVSRIKSVDGESLLAPSVLQRILAAAVQLLDEARARDRTKHQDTRLDGAALGEGED